MNATDIRVERRQLPEVPDTGHEPIDRFDTYAVVTVELIRGEVERYCYWDPKDGQPST